MLKHKFALKVKGCIQATARPVHDKRELDKRYGRDVNKTHRLRSPLY